MNDIEVKEIEGKDAEELLVSDFGALALEPIERDSFMTKLRRVFPVLERECRRGEE